MADFMSEFRTYLKTVSAVTTLVGAASAGRIWFDLARQGAVLPYIVVAKGGGGQSYESLSAIAGLGQTILHVYCYGSTREQAHSVSEAVRIAIQRYRGLMGLTYVSEVHAISGEESMVDPSQEKSDIHRWIAHRIYSIHHAEATS